MREIASQRSSSVVSEDGAVVDARVKANLLSTRCVGLVERDQVGRADLPHTCELRLWVGRAVEVGRNEGEV